MDDIPLLTIGMYTGSSLAEQPVLQLSDWGLIIDQSST